MNAAVEGRGRLWVAVETFCGGGGGGDWVRVKWREVVG